ncbi:pullulanase-type alpha-1,6-glucosidase [Serinibacter salmoneus]|uniref:pullulanase-type alpha-1,6-glucosidase n=1 Tax=Serinibacter salmoneus TaxID=556530 RepID=UPI001FE4E3CB|nr:pullulanase-type alpha-1,6-glucosidase [Serinibacter salmoneus]
MTAGAATAVPSLAEPLEPERTATLVGDLQTELGCESDWAPDCEATLLTPTGTEGVYTLEGELPAGSYEYKIAIDGAWDEAYGLDGGGDNIPLTIGGDATLRFSYDDTTHRTALTPLTLAADEDAAADAAVLADPVRNEGAGESFYFVMTDRFANGDPGNDTAGIAGDRLEHGFDPTDKGFFHGGDVQGLRDQLDYIEGLGTTAIWLTPSFKNAPVQGTGADASAGYHGYWITDFTQIDPHLGTNAELEALIAEAHARDIKVYFDIITNHTADVIDYAEGEYSYIDQATSPYLDAEGTPFDPADYAGGDTFPAMDPATSFPYTPVIAAEDADLKVPAWLNDPTLYHNRGDSTWSGESVTYGDFVGLDDLMTEHPDVVDGFIEIYEAWVDLGIDGFRIDTVKHVNFEFWELFSAAIAEHADAVGNPDFFAFGEVYDADAALLSPYVRDTAMDATLDFAFQSVASSWATGGNSAGLANLFAADDLYTTATTNAQAQPTFLGNHDMGRIGYDVRGADDPVAASAVAHSLMYLTRGQPVVYYGDEQGFVGDGDLGGTDKDARQSLFATQVTEFAEQNLLDGTQAGSVDRYDTDAALYEHIATLADLRQSTPALTEGAQITRLADGGTFVASRVHPDERIEHLVAVTNGAEQTVTVTTLTPGATYTPLLTLSGEETLPAGAPVTATADGEITLTIPARGAVVLVADTEVAAGDDTSITVEAPTPGAAMEGVAPVAAAIDADTWAQTSFAYRVVGASEWTPLGVAETTSPRVFHDVTDLAAGTLIEYRAVRTDAAGTTTGTSTFAGIGHAVDGVVEDGGGEGDLFVTVPGSHNAAMGCTGDWQPGCEAAALSEATGGIYTGTFDIPAGTYEYKAAVGGTWDINYGAGGEPNGANIVYTHEGGDITFYFDPDTGIVWNTAQGPIITLAGSFQSELGCDDWSPDQLCAWMQPSGEDGIFTFATTELPAGAYETKVTHGLSWAENYGADGVSDGANIPFSVSEGTQVVFTYDVATHLLTIEVADPPLAGTGEERAHWVSADLLAYPAALGSGGSYALHHSPDATLEVVDGAVTGGEALALEVVEEGLPQDIADRFPALADFTALRLVDADAAQAAQALRGQVMVSRSDGETLTAFTGVQIPGVLDDLYAADLAEVTLGLDWGGTNPLVAALATMAGPAAAADAAEAADATEAAAGDAQATATVWAPTAQSVELVRWDGATGSETVLTADRDDAAGSWSAGPLAAGDAYRWRITVYAPATGAIETNEVTDPYSVALTTNSVASVAVDLSDPALAPSEWAETASPVVARDVDQTIWELHVRDFSIGDETVPEADRGTYRAFTHTDSAGMTHLRELAEAGITTVHLLPTFDIASIEEDPEAQAAPECDLAGMAPDSADQQECVGAIRGEDGYNWGYDPYHFMAPEGSYATSPEGTERVSEFREMVGALHAADLQVVLDQVYNHTAASGQAPTSVLDRVVPGYYHRLNAAGGVETSTCCQNIATEHEVAERLMVDSVVLWARDYKVDGFRFDLMGHHSLANMQAVREALDALTLEEDGVDGSAVYLYGEGWDFGEVAGDALFEQARQANLAGTGIGSFNDRLRDGVHGGSPVDGSSTFDQGFGTGLGTDPNGRSRTGAEDLGHLTDLVKLGMAGNLAEYSFTASTGETVTGAEVDYNGSPAGYAGQPSETINYVDAHDNETLFDLAVFKLPTDTPMDERVRANTVQLATVALGQSPSFWHAGTELLRSKSLDRDSYDSGDWFNRIDWTGQENTFGSGLPGAWSNEEKWDLMAPLLADASLKPDAAAMASSYAQALDLLRVRSSVDLLRLGSTQAVQEKVTFPGSGPDEAPGTIAMLIDDTVGSPASESLDGALVLINASPDAVTRSFPELAGREFVLNQVQAEGSDDVVTSVSLTAEGSVEVPARSYVVLVEEAEVQPPPTGDPTETPTGAPTSPGPSPSGTTGSGGSGSDGSDGLPSTGASVAGLVLAALALVGFGTLLIRRRATRA